MSPEREWEIEDDLNDQAFADRAIERGTLPMEDYQPLQYTDETREAGLGRRINEDGDAIEHSVESRELNAGDEASRHLDRIGDYTGSHETVELERIRREEVTRRLAGIDNLRPERWELLDQTEREWTLRSAGRELGDVYRSPDPIFLSEELDSPQLEERGMHVAGQFRPDDALINVDEHDLASSDPKDALRAYLHEWRHAYQEEQVSAWHNRPNLVEDPVQADTWDREMDRYTSGERDFDTYRHQAVESDARDFSDDVVRRIYPKTHPGEMR